MTGSQRLSAQARARLDRPPPPPLRPPPATDDRAVAAWRAEVHRGWLDGDPAPDDVGHHGVRIDGVRCLQTVAPTVDDPQRPLIVYFHGGGYALGSPEVAVPITERLARFGSVVSVDYRLAPEHPFPAAVEDGEAVLRHLAASDDRPIDRLVVLVGDSAGANIAVSVGLRLLTAEVAHQLDGLVLLSPHLGPPSTDRGRTWDPRSHVDDAAERWLWDAYRGSRPMDDPQLSPLELDLRGLPPVLIQAGSLDVGLDHGRRFVERAHRSGVSAELDVWPGLWHTWHYHRELPEAAAALAKVGPFLAGLVR